MGSSILKYATMIIFMFSTIYGMAFYYYDGVSQEGLADLDGNPISGDSSILDFILETISWFSPFLIIKGLMVSLLPSELYEPFNLFILRPMGWIGAWISTEWGINKIRGTSET